MLIATFRVYTDKALCNSSIAIVKKVSSLKKRIFFSFLYLTRNQVYVSIKQYFSMTVIAETRPR